MAEMQGDREHSGPGDSIYERQNQERWALLEATAQRKKRSVAGKGEIGATKQAMSDGEDDLKSC